MKTKTWPYGTRLNGVVQEVIEGSDSLRPRMTLVIASGEGFVMMGVNHEIRPTKCMYVTIEFKQGGPTGGYWQIVNPEPTKA